MVYLNDVFATGMCFTLLDFPLNFFLTCFCFNVVLLFMKLNLAVKPHMPFLRNFFVDINVFFKKNNNTQTTKKTPKQHNTKWENKTPKPKLLNSARNQKLHVRIKFFWPVFNKWTFKGINMLPSSSLFERFWFGGLGVFWAIWVTLKL